MIETIGQTTPTFQPTITNACTSFFSGGPVGFYINNFTLDGISAASNCVAPPNINNTAFSSANLTAGNTYSFTLSAFVSFPMGSLSASIWIDTNNDGDFDDSGELIYSGTGSSPSSLTGTLTIPLAVFGRKSNDANNLKTGFEHQPTYIDSYSNAEVEDYAVPITASNPCDVTLNSNSPFCEGKPLNLIATSSAATYAWQGPNGFTSNVQNPTIPNATSIASGVYTLTITDGIGGSCTTTATTSVTVYSNAVCTGLIGHYKLDGDATDASGNNLDGLISGTLSSTTDRFGNANGAMHFNGDVNNRIAVADHPLFRPTNVTLSAWVKMEGSGFQAFVGKNFGTCIQNPWQLGFDGGNLSSWSFYDANNCNAYSVLQHSPFPSNTWVHLVQVVDTDNDMHKLYMNGSLVASQAYTGSIIYDDKPVFFGMDIDNGGMFGAFNGDLDDVRIYGSALTNEQISDLYSLTECRVSISINSNKLCEGNTLELSAPNGYTYSWSGPNGFNSTNQNLIIANVTSSASGIYTLTATGLNSGTCTATATVSVIVYNNSICTGLIGHYKLDNNADDASGNNLDGVINGTLSAATDRFGNPNGAIHFDGNANNFIEIADDFLLRPKNLTLSTWVKASNFNGYQAYVSKVFGNNILNSWEIYFDGSNLAAAAATSTGSYDQLSSSPVNPNTWFHITQIIDTDNDIHKMYINGVLVASKPFTNSILYDNKPIFFGRDSDFGSASGLFYGDLDDVRIYGSVLTDQQVLSLYNSSECIQPTISANTVVCAGSTLALSASLADSYAWTGPNGFTSTIQNPSIINVTASNAGVYTVTVTTSNNCINTAQITITVNECMPAGALNFDGIDDKVELGSWFDYQEFSIEMWLNPAVQQNTWANILDDNHVGNTNVVCQQLEDQTNTYIFGANGRVVQFSLQPNTWQHVALVRDDESLKVYVNGTLIDEKSNDGSITYTNHSLRLGAWGNGGRHWNGSINELRIWNRPISQAQIQANMNCELVGIPDNLQAYYKFNQGLVNADNNNQTMLIDATNSHAGIFNNFAFNGTISNFIKGVFEQSCVFNIAAYKPTICAGKTTSLYALNCTGNINWADGSTQTSRLNISPINTYSASCTVGTTLPVNSNTLNIIINPLPNPTASSNSPQCVGNTLTLNSSGGGTYAWSGPNNYSSTSQNVSFNSATTTLAGTYTVTVTNANGCSATATTSVTINPLPNPTASSNSPQCVGNTLTLNSSGGGTYVWRGPNNYSSTSQNVSFNSATTTLAGTYTVTVTNANGCSATATTSVTINPLPNPTASSNSPQCVGNTLTLNSSGGGTYVWRGPNNYSSTSQNISFNSATTTLAGTYTVTVTNANGCSATATTSVTINPLPNPTASSNSPQCVGNTLTLNSSGGGTYVWRGPNNYSSTSQNISFNSATTTLAGTYTVTVTNANGCSATATTSVTINPLPNPTASSNSPQCVGNTLTLNSSGGGTYAWSGPNNYSSTSQNVSFNSATTTLAGTYTVTVTNANGCSATATTSVTINPLPNPTASSNSPQCVGNTLTLNSSGGGTYVWRGPNNYSSTSQNVSFNSATTTLAGTYTVTVTNANGCSATATTSVTINPLPNPTASSNSPQCVGNTLTLNSSGGGTYVWRGPNNYSSTSQNVSFNSATTTLAGTYTVTVTNANGCSATATTSVTINPLPNPTASSNSPQCVGNTLTLNSSGGGTYVWRGPNNYSSTSQNISFNSATTTLAGTYTVTVTNANGCSATATTSVTINPLPNPTASSNSPQCVGNTLTLNSSGGGTYVWRGPNNYSSTSQNVSFNSATTTLAGTYTVTVTNANGCSATATTSVTINPLPNPTASSNSPQCVGNTLTLNSSGGGTYVWRGPNNYSSTSQNVSFNSATTTLAGTYTVTVTNANGCSATATTSVTINPLPNPTASSNSPQCVGNTLTLNSSGGGTYVWRGPNNYSSTSQNVSFNSATTTLAGTYTVTVTNANGCSATATTSVTINPLPNPTASSNSPQCVGNTLTLNSSGGGTYVWRGPNNYSSTSQNISFNSATTTLAGTYTVTVTNANGCSATATTSVTINPLPNPTASSNSPQCVGNTLTLNSSGGGTYAWSGPNNYSSTSQNVSFNSATTTLAGTYTVTVTNANGCSATATTSVTINPLPNPTASSNSPQCVGNTLTLNSSGGGTYVWRGPNNYSSTSQNVSFNSATTTLAGTYTVTVTNANGCSATATTSVTINPLPNPTASSNSPQCVGNTLTLNSSGGGTYVWRGPNNYSSTSQNISFNSATTTLAGTYTVTVTNANGCSATATTSVTINPLPNPTASSNSPQCVGNTLTLNSSGGGTYVWRGPNNYSSTSQNVSFNSATTTLAGTYTVTVTNANGCSATATTSVTINPLPNPTASSNSPQCVGNTLTLNSSGGGTYVWRGPNNYSSTSQNVSFNSATTTLAGTYTVTVTNANGCSATATTSVTINPLPNPTASSNSPQCVGNTLTLNSSGGGTYVWRGPNNYSSTSQNISFNSATTTLAGTYTVTVTNANGCSATATTSVTINPLPNPTASSNSPQCVGNTLTLNSSGGGTYVWRGPNNYSSTSQNVSFNSATTTLAGTYTVTVTNANGCSATATTSVTINPLPNPTASSNSPQCVGNTLTLNSSGGGTYVWRGPNNYSSTSQNVSFNSATTTLAGTYTVTVTNANGCSATATTSVTINPLPNPTASSNSPQCVGNTLTLNSSGGGTYVWRGPNNYSSTSQNVSFNSATTTLAGTYTVTVTNANGCSATATTSVTINPLPNPTASSNSPQCVGNTLTLNSSGGGTYVWRGPNNYSSTSQNVSFNSATTTLAGTYTVTVTNANGCSATATTSVTINPLPNPTASSNSPQCVGNTLSLNSSGGGTYVWSGPNNFSSSLQNPSLNIISATANGIYTVTATNANGCSSTATTNVTIYSVSIPTIISNSPICAGRTLTISSSIGDSYMWSGLRQLYIFLTKYKFQ